MAYNKLIKYQSVLSHNMKTIRLILTKQNKNHLILSSVLCFIWVLCLWDFYLESTSMLVNKMSTCDGHRKTTKLHLTIAAHNGPVLSAQEIVPMKTAGSVLCGFFIWTRCPKGKEMLLLICELNIAVRAPQISWPHLPPFLVEGTRF